MLKHSLEHTEPWLHDAWIILQGYARSQGQGPRSGPRLGVCAAALSALLHNLSQVHTAPSPLQGAPHLQEMEHRHKIWKGDTGNTTEAHSFHILGTQTFRTSCAARAT